MNWKIMIIGLALSGSCYAADTAEAKAAEVEAAARKTVTVYILKAKSAG